MNMRFEILPIIFLYPSRETFSKHSIQNDLIERKIIQKKSRSCCRVLLMQMVLISQPLHIQFIHLSGTETQNQKFTFRQLFANLLWRKNIIFRTFSLEVIRKFSNIE